MEKARTVPDDFPTDGVELSYENQACRLEQRHRRTDHAGAGLLGCL